MVNLQPQSSLTADMNEQSREVFVQLLLRNIRQMYYSRAYCEPRLQRFMIRAQPPQPPSQPEPPSRPQASSEPQAPSRPMAEENPAVDEKVDGVRKLFCALNVLRQLRRQVNVLYSPSAWLSLPDVPWLFKHANSCIDTSGCRRRNGQSWLWWLGDVYYSPRIHYSRHWFRQAADRVSGWGGGYGGWRQGWRVEVHHARGM